MKGLTILLFSPSGFAHGTSPSLSSNWGQRQSWTSSDGLHDAFAWVYRYPRVACKIVLWVLAVQWVDSQARVTSTTSYLTRLAFDVGRMEGGVTGESVSIFEFGIEPIERWRQYCKLRSKENRLGVVIDEHPSSSSLNKLIDLVMSSVSCVTIYGTWLHRMGAWAAELS